MAKKSKKSSKKLSPFVFGATGNKTKSFMTGAVWAPSAGDAADMVISHINDTGNGGKLKSSNIKAIKEPGGKTFAFKGKILPKDKVGTVEVTTMLAEPDDSSLAKAGKKGRTYLVFTYSDDMALQVPVVMRSKTRNGAIKAYHKGYKLKTIGGLKKMKAGYYEIKVHGGSWKKFAGSSKGDVFTRIEAIKFGNAKKQPKDFNMDTFSFKGAKVEKTEKAPKKVKETKKKDKVGKAKKAKAGKKGKSNK